MIYNNSKFQVNENGLPKIFKGAFILLFMFFLNACQNPNEGPKNASPALKDENQMAVDALFAEWDKKGSPGASIAIIQNDEILYSNGYGEAQIEYGIPIEPQTIFHVASITKQFTAFGIALLADRGELSLDDEVQKYIPEVPNFGTPITLRQLAHHTSGLRDQWTLLALGGWRLDDVITKEHVLKLVARQNALNFPPNDQYTYSNTGFTLMAETIERVGGKPFPEWMEENVFKPLGMTNTLIYDDHEKIVPNRAYSYSEGDNKTLKKSVLSYAVAGATSLFTTAEDLTLWLNNYSTEKVGGEAVNIMMQTKGILNSGEEINYALGLVVSEYRGLKFLGHGGADAGFRSDVIYFPEQKFGVSVLSNLASFNPNGLARKIADIYLKDVMTPLEVKDEGDTKAPQDGIEVAKEVLQNYVGLYAFEDFAGLTIEVTMEDGALTAVDPNGVRHIFMARTEDSFASDINETLFSFAKNEEKTFDMTINIGQDLKTKRMKPFDLSSSDLEAYVGKYYSTELETSYSIRLENGGLIASHARHPDIKLKGLEMDKFSASEWFFGETLFGRDENGNVATMSLSSGRVMNLKFDKQNR